MTNPFGAFPAPVGAVTQAPQVPGTFELSMPADPTWAPMEASDVLAKDGYFMAKVVAEKVATGNKPGVWVTVEIQDEDFAGKKLQILMQDPRVNEKVWFMWRGIRLSIYGTIEAARQAFDYRLGAFTGATVYLKAESYYKDGERKTGIQEWITPDQYVTVKKENKHRWPPKDDGAAALGGVNKIGAPVGLPGGFGTTAGFGAGVQMATPPQPTGIPPVQTVSTPPDPAAKAQAPQALPPAPAASPFNFPPPRA